MKLGLLGGSFDPPHAGHIAAARFALERFALDRVDLVPSFAPPHKPGRPLSSPFHRYAMAAMATLPEDGLAASFRELLRGGISYTIETLREAAAAEPGAQIFFILGTDQFAELASWREPRAIVEESWLIVVSRPGTDFDGAVARLPDFVARAIAGGRVLEAPMEPLPISSTEIRAKVFRGETLKGLVTPVVAEYIQRYRLYRSGG